MPDFLTRTAIARVRSFLKTDVLPKGKPSRYDRLVDAANRLPRPVLVYGAVALFLLALIRPDLFDRAMTSLDRMPEELWWLIGAVFAGHFGAREAHHLRERANRLAVPPKETKDREETAPADKPE